MKWNRCQRSGVQRFFLSLFNSDSVNRVLNAPNGKMYTVERLLI
jgi:hypothetical protein